MRKSPILMLAVASVGVLGAAAGRHQGDSEPCCNIAALDATRGAVTVKDKSGRFTFAATLADRRNMAGLRVGRAVALSNAPKALILPATAGKPAQTLSLSALRFTGYSVPGSTGVVGSAATSSGGTFTREPNNKRCPWLKETPTTQCVLTHVTASACEYFCVTINR